MQKNYLCESYIIIYHIIWLLLHSYFNVVAGGNNTNSDYFITVGTLICNINILKFVEDGGLGVGFGHPPPKKNFTQKICNFT